MFLLSNDKSECVIDGTKIKTIVWWHGPWELNSGSIGFLPTRIEYILYTSLFKRSNFFETFSRRFCISREGNGDGNVPRYSNAAWLKRNFESIRPRSRSVVAVLSILQIPGLCLADVLPLSLWLKPLRLPLENCSRIDSNVRLYDDLRVGILALKVSSTRKNAPRSIDRIF